MTLLDLQRRFHATIAAPDDAEDEPWPEKLRPGIAVYRNAYQARLVACLRAAYPRCLARTGDDAFDAAAAHHVILHPPTSWTLDALGAGFDATLADLFPHNPELAELAWLEWHMSLAFSAADRPCLDRAGFAAATSGFGEREWAIMTLTIAPELAMCAAAHDLGAIWEADDKDGGECLAPGHGMAGFVAVWRVALEPRFRLLDDGEAAALTLANDGASFAQICNRRSKNGDEHLAAVECGAWLGRWISDGLVAAINVPDM